MTLTMRPYRDEDDYWRIHAFLREVFPANGRREYSWPVARLDYWRWLIAEDLEIGEPVEQVVFLWETSDGRIAAALNPENRDEAFLQVHPDHRSAELEEEMMVVAEERLGREIEGGKRLRLWSHDGDMLRPAILERRGYVRPGWLDRKRSRVLEGPLPEMIPPPGYTVRSQKDDELPARGWASWRAFHPDEPDDAYGGWEWCHTIQRMPLYRRDLDIVAVTADGEIASFGTLWYDDVTRSGYFEPVGTVPEHQRRGLATAVMLEAMRRLQGMGGTLPTVGGLNPAADALYQSVMSPDAYVLVPWERRW